MPTTSCLEQNLDLFCCTMTNIFLFHRCPVSPIITPQQWTEGRPPQQWRIRNYVCHVNVQNLNQKNLSAVFCSSWSISVILWAQSNKQILPALPVCSLLLLTEQPNMILVASTVQRKIIRAKPTRPSPCAANWSDLCELNFLQESVSASALAPSVDP